VMLAPIQTHVANGATQLVDLRSDVRPAEQPVAVALRLRLAVRQCYGVSPALAAGQTETVAVTLRQPNEAQRPYQAHRHQSVGFAVFGCC
jgi:hypothetical protein